MPEHRVTKTVVSLLETVYLELITRYAIEPLPKTMEKDDANIFGILAFGIFERATVQSSRSRPTLAPQQ